MNDRRRLRYAAVQNGTLAENWMFQLGRSHALCAYASNSIYTFIPKNACSTLRLSLAIANGAIASPDQVEWIHMNNVTFSANLRDLATADYTFVVVRDPLTRLASTWLDQIVGRKIEVWELLRATQYAYDWDRLTFRRFAQLVCPPGPLRWNIHWQPQVEFLVYERYDDVFVFERFAEAQELIRERAGIEVIDARSITRHGTDQYTLVDDRCYADATPRQVRRMRTQGLSPSHLSLYDQELQELVKFHYADDFVLHANAMESASSAR